MHRAMVRMARFDILAALAGTATVLCAVALESARACLHAPAARLSAKTPIRPAVEFTINGAKLSVALSFFFQCWARGTTMLCNKHNNARPCLQATTARMRARIPSTPRCDLTILRTRTVVTRAFLLELRARCATNGWLLVD